MKKYLLLLCIAAMTFFVAIIGCGKKADETTQTKTETPTEMKDSVTIVTVGVDSMDALQVLKQSHDVNEVSSAMGTFVKGIDGVENDMYTFWFFEVNHEMGNKAADKTMTTESDTIRWYFRQPGAEKPDEKK